MVIEHNDWCRRSLAETVASKRNEVSITPSPREPQRSSESAARRISRRPTVIDVAQIYRTLKRHVFNTTLPRNPSVHATVPCTGACSSNLCSA